MPIFLNVLSVVIMVMVASYQNAQFTKCAHRSCRSKHFMIAPL